MLRGLVAALCVAGLASLACVTASSSEDRLWEALSGRSDALKAPATWDRTLLDKKDGDAAKPGFAAFAGNKSPKLDDADRVDPLGSGQRFSESQEALGLKELWTKLALERVRRAADSDVVKFTVRTVKDAVFDELSPSQRILLKVVPVVAASSIMAAPRWLDEAFDIRNRAAAAAERLSESAHLARRKARDAAQDFLQDPYNTLVDLKEAGSKNLGDVWKNYNLKLKGLLLRLKARLLEFLKK